MPNLDPLKIKFQADTSSATSSVKTLSKVIAQSADYMLGFENATTRAASGLKSMKTSSNSTKNALASLKHSIGSLSINTVAFVYVARKLSQGLASCIKNSMDFVETMNLFNVSMGDNAIVAGEFAEKVQQAFGIDMAEWMRNQGVFQTLIEGFGVSSEKADIMSQQVTQLGYDLSSLFNLPFAESMQKLQSGIAGELEPLRRLGFDLSQAKLQQIAYDHGIQQTVSTMTQAQKVQLRYYAIMTQVTTAHGDMARTITQPANMLRVFKENVVITSRAIGNLFIPILQKFLSVAIVVARGIAKVANAIASLLGLDTTAWQNFVDDLNYSGDTFDDVSDGIDDVGSSAGKATNKVKEFKKQFLGFDKINNITLPDISNSSGGSGGGAGGVSGGGDLDLPLPTYDFLQGIEDAFAEAHPKLAALFEALSSDFGHWGSILGEALRDALKEIDWESLEASGRSAAEFLANGLNQFFSTPGLFTTIGSTLANALNTALSTADAFATTFDWPGLGKSLGQAVNGFVKDFKADLAAITISDYVEGALDVAINFMTTVDWGEVGKKFVEFVTNVDYKEITIKFLTLGGATLESIGELLMGITDGVAELWIKILGIKYAVQGINNLLDWLAKVCTGDENAEFSVHLSVSRASEAFVKLFEWLMKVTGALTTGDISLVLKVLAEGPGVEWGNIFKSDEELTKDAKLNLKEGTLDPGLQKGGTTYETYDHYKTTKTSKVNVESGKVDSAVKKDGSTYKTYGHYKESKTSKISLGKGTISKALLKNGSVHNAFHKYYNKTATVSVKGTATIDKNTKVLEGLLEAKTQKNFKFKTTGSMITMTPMTQAGGGIYANGKWRPVTAAAGGGGFNTGQMFIAREAGPELVGRIGGRTAVMNNDQIVSSVAAGVASANSTQISLLRQLISAVKGGSQEIVLQVDSTKLGEVSIKSINKVQRQQGRTLLMV